MSFYAPFTRTHAHLFILEFFILFTCVFSCARPVSFHSFFFIKFDGWALVSQQQIFGKSQGHMFTAKWIFISYFCQLLSFYLSPLETKFQPKKRECAWRKNIEQKKLWKYLSCCRHINSCLSFVSPLIFVTVVVMHTITAATICPSC